MLSEIRFKRRLLIFILILVGGSLLADPVPLAIESSIDTSLATIGDRIHLRLSMQYPAGTQFLLPEFGETLGRWDLLDQRLSEPQKIPGGFRQELALEITVFDTGRIVVPEIELRVVDAEDSTRAMVFTTDEYVVDVISVLPPGTTEPKDIKPPFGLPRIIPWSYILFALLIVGILIAWWILYRRWKRQQPPKPLDEHYLEPPHVAAFRELEALKAGRYKTGADMRQFYFRLSEIVREYLERRYFIRALEMTTREILETFGELELVDGVAKEFKQLFEGLDLVKFANILPATDKMLHYWDLAYNCIDKTKREPFLNRRSS